VLAPRRGRAASSRRHGRRRSPARSSRSPHDQPRAGLGLRGAQILDAILRPCPTPLLRAGIATPSSATDARRLARPLRRLQPRQAVRERRALDRRAPAHVPGVGRRLPTARFTSPSWTRCLRALSCASSGRTPRVAGSRERARRTTSTTRSWACTPGEYGFGFTPPTWRGVARPAPVHPDVHAERVAYRNLSIGYAPRAGGKVDNPYRSGWRPDTPPTSSATSTRAIRAPPPNSPTATPRCRTPPTACTGRCGAALWPPRSPAPHARPSRRP